MLDFSYPVEGSMPRDLASFFARFQFAPIMDWPNQYEVYDFSQGYDSGRDLKFEFGVGKYDEKRPGMYQGELYDLDQRDIHVGIDLAAPVGYELRAFFSGEVLYTGYNAAAWDYGYTLVTRHQLEEFDLFALWGHLSQQSIEISPVGRVFRAGDALAFVGDKNENGGWNPHLHFQLSWNDPKKADLPGVVSEMDRSIAKKIFPDPQWVLGKLYENSLGS